ncbi:MAG: short-chain dehydrogenase [Ilumatobacteraceae bacterium]|nr:short-chain dehydrogenase [Ilumatobacteraceae bacterium]MCU1389888.1 short-chain dehydrogenase [Ilumatobacteraceae bacterium]
MDLDLVGRTALVTGGSRGIGRAIARALAAEGARVAICARSADAVAATVQELRDQTGADVIGLVADMGSRDDIVALVDRVAVALGPVQILVNNAATAAGRAKPPALAEITRDALLAEVDVKVLGYLFAAQAVAPQMRAAGWGRIINIAGGAALSTGSTIGSIRNVAVAALTKNLADELGPSGITVNCIHPSLTRTVRSDEVTDPAGRAQAATIEQRIPETNSIRAMIDDSDLAPLAAFLASPLSFVINGEMIAAGGGVPGAIRY